MFNLIIQMKNVKTYLIEVYYAMFVACTHSMHVCMTHSLIQPIHHLGLKTKQVMMMMISSSLSWCLITFFVSLV